MCQNCEELKAEIAVLKRDVNALGKLWDEAQNKVDWFEAKQVKQLA